MCSGSDNVTVRCDWRLHCLTVLCLLSDSSAAACTCKRCPERRTDARPPSRWLTFHSSAWSNCVWTTRCSDWLCPAVLATLSRTQLTALQEGGMDSSWRWWRMETVHCWLHVLTMMTMMSARLLTLRAQVKIATFTSPEMQNEILEIIIRGNVHLS